MKTTKARRATNAKATKRAGRPRKDQAGSALTMFEPVKVHSKLPAWFISITRTTMSINAQAVEDITERRAQAVTIVLTRHPQEPAAPVLFIYGNMDEVPPQHRDHATEIKRKGNCYVLSSKAISQTFKAGRYGYERMNLKGYIALKCTYEHKGEAKPLTKRRAKG